ncbi:PREDICTED: transcription factor CP2-like, partial [Sturnus vulgaris]|uniref:transcription factor CP2-like n=1 Tax=Sturnus vulgaris TaxID=9172 RepID=UPI00071A783D
MAWALKLPLADEVIESGLVQDFDASLSGIGQELGAGDPGCCPVDPGSAPGCARAGGQCPGWQWCPTGAHLSQVHCISTEFTLRKHGGEKGVPFRVQIDTFRENESGEYTEHLHSASCQIKVFKPKGADR